ncbi:MAG: nucleoside triphosphate pyrophosphohydrolase [Cytophagaceae bacterium]|jgi:XTP/dITP diphosphohydrolase|nr:nucleoside triphosphate pyrophosphohydrolase [Cytophagaceae bacterium]
MFDWNQLSPQRQQQLMATDRILTIMDELREKCPWDKKQTLDSLRHLTIEETYELSDAILQQKPNEIEKELGDVFLHIIFYSKIGSEQGVFDYTSVLEKLCEKMIRRHPHIYGDVVAEDEEAVKRNWEQIKQQEKPATESILSGVPKSLPALVKAIRIQEKARGIGFDWENKEQVWEKVEEELAEFKAECTAGAMDRATEELGDVIFSIINYARFIGISPEDALEKTNLKFIRRFMYLEKAAHQAGRKLSEMTLAEMDVYWNEAKQQDY